MSAVSLECVVGEEDIYSLVRQMEKKEEQKRGELE